MRLADAAPTGRLRLDAVARYLQDVAADDVRDAGLAGEVAWVVRRTAIEVAGCPAYDDVVDVTTWCSGIGAAWAERRTTITGPAGAVIEAAAVWVSLDPATMRPVAPGARFVQAWGPVAGGRRIRTRLSLPSPPQTTMPDWRPWPLRSSDIDLLGHVNNAVAWTAVEDELDRRGQGTVTGAELEYRAAITPGASLRVGSDPTAGALHVWLIDDRDDAVAISAVVRTGEPHAPSPP